MTDRQGDTFVEALVYAVPQTPYSSYDVQQAIALNRQKLDGTLFFDTLAHELAHINNGKYTLALLNSPILTLSSLFALPAKKQGRPY